MNHRPFPRLFHPALFIALLAVPFTSGPLVSVSAASPPNFILTDDQSWVGASSLSRRGRR